MMLHPLALSIAVGGLASHPVADAFVLPKYKRVSETARYHPTTRAGTTSIRMAGKNDGSQYVSLEEILFDGNEKGFNNNDSSSSVNKSDNSSASAKNPTTPQKKPIKPNPRTEKLRAKLEADLAAAEESRTRTAQQLADAESSRLAIEAEAAKSIKEANALEEKLKAFEAKEAARAVAGGGGGLGATGIAGEIVGPIVGGFAAFGGLAVARDSLAARSQKAEEERLQKAEEERKAEQVAKRKVEQEAQTKKILPIVGAGVAGLGAFGAFFGSEGGGNSIFDAISKNVPEQAKVGQQKNAASVTTAIPDPSASVNLPYLDKEINKAETKQQQKERLRKPKSTRQSGRDVSEEQRTAQARLEQKLAEAPELARKAAEAKVFEEARIEAEKKALLEKETAERKVAEEKAAVEKVKAEKIAAERKAAEEAAAAAEKVKAEKIAAEKKVAEEAAAAAEKAKAEKIAAEKAKAEKIAADKLAFERMKAEEEKSKAEKIASEQQFEAEKVKAEKIAADKLAFEKLKAEQKAEAEQRARAEEAAASLQLLKQQDGQFSSFFPKVPAVSEMLFGNNRPSMIAERGLSNIFSPNKIVVGGVALAGVAIAAAVVAANESPSVSSTFKVTGKSPKEYLESEGTDTNVASAPKKTIRIPRPEKQESEASNDDPQNSPSALQTGPSPGSKEALREDLVRQRDSINRQAAEKSSRDSSAENTLSSLSPTTEVTSIDASNMENMGNAGPTFVSSPAKSSFSPFRGVKPKSVIDDALYSPPASEASSSSAFRRTPEDQPISPSKISAAEKSTSDGVSSSKITKKSFSPFGGGKPKSVVNDSLYSPPVSSSSTTDNSRDQYPVQSIEQASDQNAIGGTEPAIMPKRSYSPFGGGTAKFVSNDSLYSPPVSSSSTTDSSGDENPVQSNEQASDQNIIGGTESATMPKRSYSPFGGGKPKVASNDSLYSPPASRFSSDIVGEVPSALKTERGFSSFEESNPEVTIGGSLESMQSSPYDPEPVSTKASPYSSNSSTRAPKNYSPFSGGKPTAAMDDSLYRPPSSEGQPDSEDYSLGKTEPTIASKGDNKPVSASNDSLYSTPTNEPFDMNMNGEESMLFTASGLNSIPGAAERESPDFRRTSLKKSFSPFGSKPQAPSGTSGNDYLDNL